MRYKMASDVVEAVSLLEAEAGTTRVLAGGTDVLVQLRAGMVEPDLVVDIKRIPGIGDVVAENGGFRVGAAVSGAELGENSDVRALWPGVVEALELIGSTQIQGRATMVGNLCNASPAADSVPAMIAAEATVRIAGPDGERDAPVQSIPVAPGQTSLKKGEIVTSVFLPARPENSGDAFLRFIPRTEMDIAVVSAGVSLTLDDAGSIAVARVSLGAVAATVLLVEEAGAALVGSKLDSSALDKLAAACSAAASPIDDKRGTVAFRKHMAGVLAKRVAILAYERAGGGK